MHSLGLLHLDIKPDNIFLGFDGRCKLGDFGITLGPKVFSIFFSLFDSNLPDKFIHLGAVGDDI